LYLSPLAGFVLADGADTDLPTERI
jgi:hypothetical protein